MTITLDYDNDQIRIEDAGPLKATFTERLNEQAIKQVGQLFSVVFDRLGFDHPLDITLRRQSDGELQTLEEW